ncbi:hypothetical protein Bca101_058998 [Brassica carinata]
MKAGWLYGEWKGVSFALGYLLASSMVTFSEEDVYGLGAEGMEAAISGLLSRTTASPRTPSRDADGVILDGLVVTRRLILCEDVDEKVSWKL